MSKKPKLRTVQDVVDAFGGTKATAEWADVGMSAVSNWIEREHIPPGWHYRIVLHLGPRFEIDPGVFGFVKDDPPHSPRRERASSRAA